MSLRPSTKKIVQETDNHWHNQFLPWSFSWYQLWWNLHRSVFWFINWVLMAILLQKLLTLWHYLFQNLWNLMVINLTAPSFCLFSWRLHTVSQLFQSVIFTLFLNDIIVLWCIKNLFTFIHVISFDITKLEQRCDSNFHWFSFFTSWDNISPSLDTFCIYCMVSS